MYGAWKDWDGTPLAERPAFYHGCTDAGVEAVEGMQSEAVAVIDALCARLGLPYPRELKDIRADLAVCYGDAVSDPSTLGSLLRTNKAYDGIMQPMKPAPGGGGMVPDWGARVLTEDVPCGLCALRGAAEVLGVPTPWVDRVMEWAQARMGKEYLVGGRMVGRDVGETDAPQAFGEKAPEDLLLLRGPQEPPAGAPPPRRAAEPEAPCALAPASAAAAAAMAERAPLVFSH